MISLSLSTNIYFVVILITRGSQYHTLKRVIIRTSLKYSLFLSLSLSLSLSSGGGGDRNESKDCHLKHSPFFVPPFLRFPSLSPRPDPSPCCPLRSISSTDTRLLLHGIFIPFSVSFSVDPNLRYFSREMDCDADEGSDDHRPYFIFFFFRRFFIFISSHTAYRRYFIQLSCEIYRRFRKSNTITVCTKLHLLDTSSEIEHTVTGEK